jgi:hypothetical protein
MVRCVVWGSGLVDGTANPVPVLSGSRDLALSQLISSRDESAPSPKSSQVDLTPPYKMHV